jgi:hypothetical protein
VKGVGRQSVHLTGVAVLRGLVTFVAASMFGGGR